MFAWIARFVATKAATGWALAVGLSLFGAAIWAYDIRGDKIADLKLGLAKCQGSAKQAQMIQRLSEKLSEQAQVQADDEVQSIEDLPNDCYDLDGPSPINRVREPED